MNAEGPELITSLQRITNDPCYVSVEWDGWNAALIDLLHKENKPIAACTKNELKHKTKFQLTK